MSNVLLMERGGSGMYLFTDEFQHSIDNEPGHQKRQTLQGEAVKFVKDFRDDDGAAERRNLLQEELPDGDRSKEGVHSGILSVLD